MRGLAYVFIDGLGSLKDPRRLAMVFLLSLPVWLMEALMYYIIAFSFDLHTSFGLMEMAGVILLVTAVSNLATSIPAAGGGIGAFEVAAAVHDTHAAGSGGVSGRRVHHSVACDASCAGDITGIRIPVD